MRAFINYYKWHLIFALLAILCTIYVVADFTKSDAPDLVVGYVGIQYLDEQAFKDNVPSWKKLLIDSNDNGEQTATLRPYIFDRQKDIDDLLPDVVEEKECDLYISSKETFENYKDKSQFEDLSTFLNVDQLNVPVLKDSSGRAYAVSAEKSTFPKTYMGFSSSKNLYIAVATPKDGEELSNNLKNARNIAKAIIEGMIE